MDAMSKTVIDLTLPIHEGMTTFPVLWHPYVEITQLGRHSSEGRETRKMVLGTHTGTHMDAPRHFISGGKTIDQLDPELFVGPCTLLDLSGVKPFGEVSTADMKRCLDGAKPTRLMMRFDWSDRIFNREYYSDHPFLSEECAQYLVDIGVKLLAMDTPMPDNPKNGRNSDNDSPNHKILLGNDVILVEYVTNLRALGKTREFELIVLPLNIQHGDGAPVRCLARLTPG